MALCIVLVDFTGIVIHANQAAKTLCSSLETGGSLTNSDMGFKVVSSGERVPDAIMPLPTGSPVPLLVTNQQGAFEGELEKIAHDKAMLSWATQKDWESDSVSEEFRLRAMLEGTQAGTWQWNVQTGHVHFNDRWAQMLGYTLEELKPLTIETWLRMAHPEDLKLSEERLQAHFSGQKPYYECEVRVRHKNDQWRWIRDYGRVVSRNEQGEVEWVVGTHIDITDLIEAKQSKERLSDELQAILSSTPSIIFKSAMDDDYAATFISDDVQQKLGYRVEEITENTGWWYNAIHPDDRSQSMAQFEHWHVSQSSNPLLRRYRLKHKDGHYLWVEERLQPPNSGSEFVGALTLVDEVESLKYRLEKIAEVIPGVIYQFVLEQDGTMSFPYASQGIESIYHVSPEEARQSASTVIDKIHKDDQERVLDSINQSAEELSDWICEYRVEASEGHRWVYGHAIPEKHDDGSTLWHGMIVDINDKKELELQLEKSLTRLKKAQEIGRLGYWEANLETGELYWSDMVYTLLGLDKAQITPSVEYFFQLTHPEDQTKVRASQEQAKTIGVHDVEHRMRHSDGHYIWVHELASFSPDQQRLSGTVRDITKQKNLELDLKRLVVTDALTGVFNRRHFISNLKTEITRLKRLHEPLCVAMMDFDHFKVVNDTYGHQAGDEVLCDITSRITSRLRAMDTLARIGGEEFAIMMPGTALNEAKALIKELLSLIRTEPVQTDTDTIPITVTFGLTAVNETDTWGDALKRADEALYKGKANGRDQVQVHMDHSDRSK